MHSPVALLHHIVRSRWSLAWHEAGEAGRGRDKSRPYEAPTPDSTMTHPDLVLHERQPPPSGAIWRNPAHRRPEGAIYAARSAARQRPHARQLRRELRPARHLLAPHRPAQQHAGPCQSLRYLGGWRLLLVRLLRLG